MRTGISSVSASELTTLARQVDIERSGVWGSAIGAPRKAYRENRRRTEDCSQVTKAQAAMNLTDERLGAGDT